MTNVRNAWANEWIGLNGRVNGRMTLYYVLCEWLVLSVLSKMKQIKKTNKIYNKNAAYTALQGSLWMYKR